MNESEKELIVLEIGRQPYRPVWEFQKTLHALRLQKKIPDVLILLEHDPVYTIGKNGTDLHIIAPPDVLKEKGIDVVAVDRGGDVTYHGPGQVVGYPIFDLRQHRRSISWFMRTLEEVFLRTLAEWQIAAGRVEDFTGVWVGDEKIVALGVRIAKWITMHGFAFNVNTELDYFGGIIPCGIFHRGVTSLKSLLRREIPLPEVHDKVIANFVELFGFAKMSRRLREANLEKALIQLAPDKAYPVS